LTLFEETFPRVQPLDLIKEQNDNGGGEEKKEGGCPPVKACELHMGNLAGNEVLSLALSSGVN